MTGYVLTMQCYASIRAGVMEVGKYQPIICQECGYRVLSRWIPERCPNEACPSNIDALQQTGPELGSSATGPSELGSEGAER